MLNFISFRYDPRSGNVLFIILIAVALFAALSYAVTQTGRGGGKAENEKSSLRIASIQNYSAQLSQSVLRLVMRGCPGESISFASPNWPSGATDYNNVKSPPDKSCNVFDVAGGGVAWQDPVKGLVAGVGQPLISGSIGVEGVGVSCWNSMSFIVAVTRDMCLEINRQAGVVNTGGEPPQWGYGNGVATVGWTRFGYQGKVGPNNMACGMSIGSGSPSASELTGISSGCYQSATGDRLYQAYTILYTNPM